MITVEERNKNTICEVARRVLMNAAEMEIEEQVLKDRMWLKATEYERSIWPQRAKDMEDILRHGANRGIIKHPRALTGSGGHKRKYYAKITPVVTPTRSTAPVYSSNDKRDEGWEVPDDDIVHELGEIIRNNPSIVTGSKNAYVYDIIDSLKKEIKTYKFPDKHENKVKVMDRLVALGYMRRSTNYHQGSYEVITNPYAIHCPAAMNDGKSI